MRTDLRLNYGELDNIEARMMQYEKAIEALQDSAKDLKSCLEGQESKSIKKLSEKIGTIDKTLQFQLQRVVKLKKLLYAYITSMDSIIQAKDRSKQIRVDTVDVWANLQQIEAASSNLYRSSSNAVISDWGRTFGEDEADEKMRQERNYNKLSSVQIGNLATLASAVKDKVAEIRKLYEGPMKKYETKDDALRKKLDGKYDTLTTKTERNKNGWRLFGRIAWAFLKAFAVAFVAAAIIATFPAWAGAIIVVGGLAAAAISSQMPEGEPTLEKIWEATKKAGQRTLDNPLFVLGCMGQGIMDQTQSPEGIATLAGTVIGGKAGNSFGQKVLKPNVNKAIDAHKAKVAQRANSNRANNVKNPKTRLPRTNGKWEGKPGDGKWYSNKPEVNKVTNGHGVEFKNGKPDFSPWSKGDIDFEPGQLNGTDKDFSLVYEKIQKQYKLPSKNAAKNLLKKIGVTPHHKTPTKIELIPSDLHGNIPHIGSASDLRGGF